MELGITYLLLMFLFFMIGVCILRWALRINNIVSELEMIRKGIKEQKQTEIHGHPVTGCK